MKQDTEWFERRLKLLQVHLQEQQQYLSTHKEARRSLKNSHEWERKHIAFTEQTDRIRWIGMIVSQAEEITNLSQKYSLELTSLITRQAKEEEQLNQQIEQEKRLRQEGQFDAARD